MLVFLGQPKRGASEALLCDRLFWSCVVCVGQCPCMLAIWSKMQMPRKPLEREWSELNRPLRCDKCRKPITYIYIYTYIYIHMCIYIYLIQDNKIQVVGPMLESWSSVKANCFSPHAFMTPRWREELQERIIYPLVV